MKQNKGFMLFETLVVSTVVLGTLVFLFIQFSAVKRTYDTSFRYNTITGLFYARELSSFIKKDSYKNIENALETKTYVNITNCLYSSSMCKKIVNNIGAKTVLFVGSNIEPLKNELKGTYDKNLFNDSFKKYIMQLSSIESGRNRLIIEFNDNTFASVTIGDDNSKEYAITNMIVNSGFEDNSETGLSKWVEFKATKNITNENKYYGNYGLKVTTDKESYGSSVSQVVNLKENHIYYASSYLYFNATPQNISQFDLFRVEGTMDGYPEYGNISLNNLKASKWSHISFNFVSGVTHNYYFRPGFVLNEDITYYIDNTMLIDLTETFGAGNEPTLDWCDSHISYFEGTSSIYK